MSFRPQNCKSQLFEADKLAGGENACLIIDDTAFPKKGLNQVGVPPQYASTLGKTAKFKSLVSVESKEAKGPSGDEVSR